MSHFERSKNSPPQEETMSDSRVMKLDTPGAPTVEKFEFGALHREGEHDYNVIRSKYGALAATDTHVDRGQKNRRFSINPLLRDPLAIEEEERRVIDERVKSEIEKRTEEAKKQGFEAGFQKGIEEGHAEAFKLFQTEASERLQRFETLIAAFESAKTEIFQTNENYLIELIFRVAKTVLLKDLAQDREYVSRLARELVERSGARENIKIQIHPDDQATVEMLKESLEKSLGTLKNLNVEVSPEVRLGGCVLETQLNKVDASVDTQLKNIHDSLVGTSRGSAEKV